MRLNNCAHNIATLRLTRQLHHDDAPADAPDPAHDEQARQHLEEGSEEHVEESFAVRRVTCRAAERAGCAEQCAYSREIRDVIEQQSEPGALSSVPTANT